MLQCWKLVVFHLTLNVFLIQCADNSSHKSALKEGTADPKNVNQTTCDIKKGLCTAVEITSKKAPVTDSEVPDLVKTHSFVNATTENPKIVTGSNKPKEEFSVDIISENLEQKEIINSRFSTTTGGIAALTCLTVACVFYVTIMIWKKIVMNSYHNREILLNDDDIGDINDEDMRHFELKFLDRDGRAVESANGR